MEMGLRELIVVCCLINGIAGRVVENEEIQNKVSGNQNNKVCLNVAYRAIVWLMLFVGIILTHPPGCQA